MKRPHALALLVVLLVGASGVAVQRGFFSRSAARSAGAETGAPASGEVVAPAKSRRSMARAGASATARHLRWLIHAAPREAPDFAALEKMAARVSADDLANLRALSASARPDSLGGWVRCAVIAEGARRDPDAALTWLTTSEDLYSYDEWALRQAWFSTFRGWARTDPAAAAAELMTYLGPPNRTGRLVEADEIDSPRKYMSFIREDERWRQQAVVEVFAEFARHDPEAAWEAVPTAEDIASVRSGALQGLFRGARDEETVRNLIARWSSELELRRLEQFADPPFEDDGPRIADPFERPGRNSIAAQAVLALEVVAPGAGREWFTGGNPGRGTDPQEIHLRLYDGFGREHPDRALAVLETATSETSTLLSSLLRHHPDRAAEAFARQRDRDELFGEMIFAISGSSYLRLEDLFPAPGRSNGLPNWEERYHDLLGVVEEGEFTPEEEAALVGRIHLEFVEVVPEARAAADVPAEEDDP